MFSRAHLLIERDFEMLKDDNIWGIEAAPLRDDNIFEWSAKILGLRGTVWEGGVFRMYLKFDENYNSRPPQVCFHTIPFHPNVDMITGKPCIDFLDDLSKWSENFSVTFILLTIQSLLSNPVLENAVNQEAGKMVITSPHSYKQMVEDCVSASQRVEAGLSPHTEDKVQIMVSSHRLGGGHLVSHKAMPKTPNTKANKVSFEDYHATWSGIATSKPKEDAKNPLIEAIKENPTLQAAHYGLPVDELRAQMEKQLEEHSTLVYGKFSKGKSKPTEDQLKQEKLEQVNKMRKIYLQPRGGTSARRMPIPLDDSFIKETNKSKTDEPWEAEVDDLVAWTNNLDTEMIT